MEGVGQHIDVGLATGHQLSVEPDPPVAVVIAALLDHEGLPECDKEKKRNMSGPPGAMMRWPPREPFEALARIGRPFKLRHRMPSPAWVGIALALSTCDTSRTAPRAAFVVRAASARSAGDTARLRPSGFQALEIGRAACRERVCPYV